MRDMGRVSTDEKAFKLANRARRPTTRCGVREAIGAGHRVCALDFSEKMVAELRHRIHREGLANVDVRVGDGMALPYPSGAFQGAFSMFGLMFFPNRTQGFSELHRVLASRARAVVSSWQPLDSVPALGLAFATLRELRPPAPGAPPIGPPLAQPEECLAEMGAAGFHDVDVVEVAHEMTAPSMSELWASMERTTAPFALAKSQLGEGWAPVSRAILDKLVAMLGAGRHTMRMPAYLTIGLR